MAATLEVVPKERGGVEHHVAALERAGEGGHVRHIAQHQYDPLHPCKLLLALVLGADECFDAEAALDQFAHKVVSEEAGSAGDKSGPQAHGLFHVD